jgi:hypothetical protein
MSAEDIAVRDPLLLDGVFERSGDMLLANHLGKALWTVFTG